MKKEKEDKEKEQQLRNLQERYQETFEQNHITKCRHYLELIFLNKPMMASVAIVLVLLTIATQFADFIHLSYGEFDSKKLKTSYLIFFLINYVAVFLANYWWTFPVIALVFYFCVTLIYYVAKVGFAAGTALLLAPPDLYEVTTYQNGREIDRGIREDHSKKWFGLFVYYMTGALVYFLVIASLVVLGFTIFFLSIAANIGRYPIALYILNEHFKNEEMSEFEAQFRNNFITVLTQFVSSLAILVITSINSGSLDNWEDNIQSDSGTKYFQYYQVFSLAVGTVVFYLGVLPLITKLWYDKKTRIEVEKDPFDESLSQSQVFTPNHGKTQFQMFLLVQQDEKVFPNYLSNEQLMLFPEEQKKFEESFKKRQEKRAKLNIVKKRMICSKEQPQVYEKYKRQLLLNQNPETCPKPRQTCLGLGIRIYKSEEDALKAAKQMLLEDPVLIRAQVELNHLQRVENLNSQIDSGNPEGSFYYYNKETEEDIFVISSFQSVKRIFYPITYAEDTNYADYYERGFNNKLIRLHNTSSNRFRKKMFERFVKINDEVQLNQLSVFCNFRKCFGSKESENDAQVSSSLPAERVGLNNEGQDNQVEEEEVELQKQSTIQLGGESQIPTNSCVKEQVKNETDDFKIVEIKDTVKANLTDEQAAQGQGNQN